MNGEYTWVSSEQLADLSVRARCADEGVLRMHVTISVTVVAIVVGFAAPTSANDRPGDPFGNHTIELNKEAPLVEVWESLRDKVLLDKATPQQIDCSYDQGRAWLP
jgi:hypothetical protein